MLYLVEGHPMKAMNCYGSPSPIAFAVRSRFRLAAALLPTVRGSNTVFPSGRPLTLRLRDRLKRRKGGTPR
jgi:hypothetical protein